MENLYARRNFLKKVALAGSGVAFLSSTSILQAFNGNDCPYEGYNPYSEEKTDLRASVFSGNHITITGKVYSKSNLNPVSNAIVEVWHLSPNSKRYRHQAKMKVNQNGEYTFITDFPNRELGRYPKVFFKITDGHKVTFTELSISNNNAYVNQKHYEENIELGNNLFPTNKTINNQQIITFNNLI